MLIYINTLLYNIEIISYKFHYYRKHLVKLAKLSNKVRNFCKELS